MADWFDQLPDEEPDFDTELKKAEKLANILGPQPGERDQKVAFCYAHLQLFEAEADREGATDARRRAGIIRSLAIRFYRRHVAGGGRFVTSKAEGQEAQIRQQLAIRARSRGRDRSSPLRAVPSPHDDRED